jgi:hypothetical protein
MSYDRQIDQACQHAITEEALFVASDRLTVKPLRPISAASSVQVYMIHALEVPSGGAYVPAKSSGTRRGPFTIQSGVNDTLEVIVDQGATQTIVLPPINQMSASRMAALLNQNVSGLVFSVVNDRLSFATSDSGPQKSIFFTSNSTAASSFGFFTNQEFRGIRTVPGWTLVSDPSTLDDRPLRLIVFDEPLRSSSDFVEISYVTIREECRRCGGTGLENDWRYDVNGDVITVRDEDLLVQELQKDFYTIKGTNQFHTWYGTQLIEFIGKKMSAGGFTQNLLVSDVYQAFNRWQSIKRQQENDVGQFVSDKEYPFRLLGVNIEESSQDPTVLFLTRGLRLPSELALTG